MVNKIVKLNKESYQKIIEQDLEWFNRLMIWNYLHSDEPLEAKHIRDVLKVSVELIYGK